MSSGVTPKEMFEQGGAAVFRGIAEVTKSLPAIAGNEPLKTFITVVFPVVGLAVGRGAHTFVAARLPMFAPG